MEDEKVRKTSLRFIKFTPKTLMERLNLPESYTVRGAAADLDGNIDLVVSSPCFAEVTWPEGDPVPDLYVSDRPEGVK